MIRRTLFWNKPGTPPLLLATSVFYVVLYIIVSCVQIDPTIHFVHRRYVSSELPELSYLQLYPTRTFSLRSGRCRARREILHTTYYILHTTVYYLKVEFLGRDCRQEYEAPIFNKHQVTTTSCWPSLFYQLDVVMVANQSCWWWAEQVFSSVFFSCPSARLRIWSRETGAVVPSRAGQLILQTYTPRLDLMLARGLPSFLPLSARRQIRRCLYIN